MRPFKQSHIVAVFGILAALYVILAVIGGIRTYSPVPLADMWDGYLYFFMHAWDGDFGMWWAQHNEHRIFLSRILFWIDLAIFRGNGIFLIVANYVLAALAFLVLHTCLKESLEQGNSDAGINKFAGKVLACVMLALLFSWIQKENFAWGFQSQFFMAQLMPLTAFFLLHRSSMAQRNSGRLFAAACLAGTAALGSMANGVLALPLLAVLALVLRMSWRRVALLAVLAVLGNFLYFCNYHAPGAHGSLGDALSHMPFKLLQYLLMYLGGPYFYLTGKGSYVAAQLGGLFLIGSALFFAWRSVKAPAQSSLQLALLTFLLYIGGTALGTAGGRLVFGVDQALASRYTTPTLMAWSVLLILYAPALGRGMHKHPTRYAWPFFLLLILLLPRQLHSLDSHADELFERKVAVLAAELGIRDERQIAAIYPSVESPLSRAREALPRKLTVFGDPAFADAVTLAGAREAVGSAPPCQGKVEEVSAIEGEFRYVAISGWMAHAGQDAVSQPVHILDRDGQVVGYAFAGKTLLEEIHAGPGRPAGSSGFKGYLLSEKAGKPIILKGMRPDCELKADAPLPYFQLKKAPIGSVAAVAGVDAVAGPNQWQGSDSQRTVAAGYKILGSYVHGDQDTGDIVLNLRRGDVVYYRSGPIGGRQFLVDSVTGERRTLPVAIDWVAMEFTPPNRAQSFTVKLTDAGAGWGEWSAIGLKN